VITENAPAPYGRTSGGVIDAVTRAGTNRFHGSVYEFFRNSALDARNFFDGSSVPPLRKNQFGAALGGPIKRQKTFFFFDYEGIRESLGVTAVSVVPSPQARQGHLVSGKDDTIYVGASFPDAEAKKGELRGIVVGNAKDGSLKAFIPDPADPDKLDVGTSASGIAADDAGSIYAADVAAHNLRKYIKVK
jgi:hypothetical protein